MPSRPKKSRPQTKIRWLLQHPDLWDNPDGSFDWNGIVHALKEAGLVAMSTDPRHITVDKYVAQVRRYNRVGASG